VGDYTELQAELEAKKAAGWKFTDGLDIDTVLALVSENDAARKELGNLRTDNAQLIYALKQQEQSYLVLRGERDRLSAEVAGLRTGYEAYEHVNAGLKAEVEVLRKDSDKWKIVQRAGDQLLADEGRAAIWSACSRILISVASELNSGRSVVTEEGVTSGGVEIGDWRVTVERINGANQGVEPDLDTLRKDAERYRWLRADCLGHEYGVLNSDMTEVISGSDLDSAIDAALGQGEQS